MSTEVRVHGEWPEPVLLRRGWAAAHARPWNDQAREIANLRLQRGSDRFLVRCVEWLAGRQVVRVLSPALTEEQGGMWRRAGFHDHLELVVHERDLTSDSPSPLHPVVEIPRADFADLARIDDEAFDPLWRVGRHGLEDAMAAAAHSTVLGVTSASRPVAFAIVGINTDTGYLQRLAVDPTRSREGMGRSLVRAGIRWARRRGARTMLLNTQPENEAAAALYASEGFVPLRRRLQVLACEGSR